MNSSRRAALLPVLAIWVAATACQPGWSPGPSPIPDPPAPGPPNPGSSTFPLTGLVRESGGPPLADVTIQTWRLATDGRPAGAATRTANDGTFLIQPQPGDVLTFNLADYFTMIWLAPADARPGQSLDLAIKLQRRLDVSAGAPVTSLLTDDDATHTEASSDAFSEGPYACGPCKQVRVVSPPSTGILRVTWTGDVPLSLWAGPAWGPPRRYTALSGEREIAMAISELPGLNMMLVGLDPASGQLGLPVTFTVAMTAR